MRSLLRDRSVEAQAVDVQCLHCGKKVRMSACVIDTQGPIGRNWEGSWQRPPFEGYYHEACASVAFEKFVVFPSYTAYLLERR